MKRISILGCILLLTITAASARPGDNSERPDRSRRLEDDEPVSIRFFGSRTADLLTRELEESFQAVLQRDFVGETANNLPAGFVHASPPGQGWAGTMWSRDGGTFMRELVMRGYYQHASLLAECLMRLVQKNQEGFYSFPEYFKGSKQGAGTELDGTASIIIGMVLLWERLPNGHPTKNHIQEFLFQEASPINYLKSGLQTQPLLAGSGEFGGGCGIQGEYDNVVQDNLAMLALLAAANMAEESGSGGLAEEYRRLAARVRDAMEKYLVDKDGCWIWCIDPKTLKPDPAIINSEINRGFGGLNGVACMYSDVLGFEPLTSSWQSIQHGEKTFMRLYRTPLRRQQFDRYGIWTMFDVFRAGLSSGPSYGDGYAIQTMLLYDKLEMADRALSWLANSTYDPVPEYKLHRESRYYFYERSYSPDAVGKIPLEEGCGALNLVNVTEPLKVSRLLLGVDDTTLQLVRIIPRIPPSWKGVEAQHWPVRTRRGVVRANILFERRGSGARLTARGKSQPNDDPTAGVS
jgi:hypothetical protein